MKNRLTCSYIPVGASGGTQAQVNQVAKLLAGQLIAAGVGPGVEAAGRYPVKKVGYKEHFDELKFEFS